jgi:hypothetical protein
LPSVLINFTQVGLTTYFWKSQLVKFDRHDSPPTVQFDMFRLFYNLTSDDIWPWFVTFDLINIWRFQCYIKNLHLVPIGLQIGQFYMFSLFYYVTSDDLWPPYVTGTLDIRTNEKPKCNTNTRPHTSLPHTEGIHYPNIPLYG